MNKNKRPFVSLLVASIIAFVVSIPLAHAAPPEKTGAADTKNTQISTSTATGGATVAPATASAKQNASPGGGMVTTTDKAIEAHQNGAKEAYVATETSNMKALVPSPTKKTTIDGTEFVLAFTNYNATDQALQDQLKMLGYRIAKDAEKAEFYRRVKTDDVVAENMTPLVLARTDQKPKVSGEAQSATSKIAETAPPTAAAPAKPDKT